MAYILKDPLLSITRKLLSFSSYACFVLAVVAVLVVLAGATFGFHTSQYAQHLPGGHRDVTMVLIQIPPVLALYGWFLRILRQIVDTVAAGDPFIVANADRLTRMGWITVAIKIVALAASGVLRTGVDAIARPGLRIDGPSLLIILALFILARVFRQGSAMREDLEGTV